MLAVRSGSVVIDWMVGGANAKNASKAVREWRSFMVGREVGERSGQWQWQWQWVRGSEVLLAALDLVND